ncbi:CD3324 family protein [Acutalibacter caecimuris]|uniref:CD3324 family protein n=1 Tax=Acutalibacter caecimuris TaxID=3093657 RepID=UPI002AC97E7C|nr:CD3324 family protein [Acutalibacter sp. M00118]
MRYVRAQDVLPPELLGQLQQYVDGAYLYIPRKQENRLAWGERTHSKQETAARNQEIYRRAQAGEAIPQLAQAYYLTEKSVRRIISAERKARHT